MNPVYTHKDAHATSKFISARRAGADGGAGGNGGLFRCLPARAALIRPLALTLGMMLGLMLCFISLSRGSYVRAQSGSETPAHIIAAARRALPRLAEAQDWSHTLETDVNTTALGCRPMKGLQLPQAIEVYRLRLIDNNQPVALHVAADGAMTQQCANTGADADAGLLYHSISSESDRDGDSLADSLDACPSIAGRIDADQPGCPQASRDDSDGDGSANSVDACPLQAGPASADGCSLFVDEDGDGIPDDDDICPQDFGAFRIDFALGCPTDGSGKSSMRTAVADSCGFHGIGVPLFERPSLAAAVIGTIDSNNTESAEKIIGRDATGFWYQIQGGWIPGSAIELSGACYNLPQVNMGASVGTGCYMRPRESTINVRRAPRGKQVAQLSPQNSYVVFGKNRAGDWLFFRQGWVSLSVMELIGDCAKLPVLDPAKVSSGSVSYCPPLYQGFLPPRIDVGLAKARIASETLANRIRAAPELGAQQIGLIPPRQIIDAVLDGPACDGAFIWWQIEVEGLIGWTVESDRNANVYYLEPVEGKNEAANGELSQASSPSLPVVSLPVESLPAASTQAAPADVALFISSANLDRLARTHVIAAKDPLQVAWTPGDDALVLLLASGDMLFYPNPGTPNPGTELAAVKLKKPDDFQIKAFDFGADDELAIGSQAGQVELITLGEQAAVATRTQLSPLLSGSVQALDWSKNGRLLAAASRVQPSKLALPDSELVVWKIEGLAADPQAEAAFHFAFPYPLTDIAFSEDGRWLAVIGERVASRRAALWIYDAADGHLVFSKTLIGMGGMGWVRASPSADLADFFYSNGDSLYLLDIDSGHDLRFYHRAGAMMPQIDMRGRVIAGTELILAIASQDADGQAQLHIVNAMNSDSPTAQLPITLDDLAFSHDGRAIALAQRSRDRVLIYAVRSQ